MLVHTALAGLRGAVRVKCLAQEHTTMSQPGIKPGQLDLETSALGMRPLRLPLLTMRRIVKYIIAMKSSSIPGTMIPCYKLLNV